MSIKTFPFTLLTLIGIWAAMPALFADDDQSGFDARARNIVAQMTLDEKISQMHGTSSKKVNRIVVGVPRLGIPDLLVTNGPAGLGPAGPGHESNATALPAPIALAATWDLDAAREYGVVAASEAADLGNTLLEAPDVGIARVPQGGRTFEAYGEDPFLTSRLAVANIGGIQSQGLIANVKHYACNDQEANRMSVSVEVDERTLREIDLPAFEVSVREAHVASLMAAYNKVNGTYCCENDILLNQILKKEWGFDGFVTSDFGAVHDTVPSIFNGLDLEMPDDKYFGKALKDAVEKGTVPVAVIDEHLVRRFRTMMKLGVWDHAPAAKPIPEKEDGAIARKLAEEGMVLLRNENQLLPLDPKSVKSIALIGTYAIDAMTGGGGSSHVKPLYKVTPLEGLQSRLGPGVEVTLNDGTDVASAVAAAKAADVVIVMVGYTQSEGGDCDCTLREMGVKGGGHVAPKNSDGHAPPVSQDVLVDFIAAANPRTVVVLKTGSVALMPWVEKVPAILEAWYPGEEDGTAVAAVLFGDYNPSGKLPLTFPKTLGDLPAHAPEQYPGVGPRHETVAHYSEGVMVGYRWYDSQNLEPLFPFGYGLSYTTFKYQNLTLSAKSLSASAPALTVEFDVANTGQRAGAEVAQVYVGIPSLPGISQPPRQLKGFARVQVDPARTAHVRVSLDARAFSYWDTETHKWKVVSGNYEIFVGASSRDIRLKDGVVVQ